MKTTRESLTVFEALGGILLAASAGFSLPVFRELCRIPNRHIPPPALRDWLIPGFAAAAIWVFLVHGALYLAANRFRFSLDRVRRRCFLLASPLALLLVPAVGLLRPIERLTTLTGVLVLAGSFMAAVAALRHRDRGFPDRSLTRAAPALCAVLVLANGTAAALLFGHTPRFAFSANQRNVDGYERLRVGDVYLANGGMTMTRVMPVPGRLAFDVEAKPGTYIEVQAGLPRSKKQNTRARLVVGETKSKPLAVFDLDEAALRDAPPPRIHVRVTGINGPRRLFLWSDGDAPFIALPRLQTAPGPITANEKDRGMAAGRGSLTSPPGDEEPRWRKICLDQETRTAVVLPVPSSRCFEVHGPIDRLALGLFEGTPGGEVAAAVRWLGAGREVVRSSRVPLDRSGWIDLEPAGSTAQTLYVCVETIGSPELGWTVACADAEPAIAAAGRPRPNIILISVDTLRADALGCYGNRDVSTPAIDALARRGVVFEDVMAPSCWTIPSHVSMLTGLYPSAHGVKGGPATSARIMGPAVETLAGRLRESGYQTLAVTGGGFLSSSWGFAHGFDRYWEADIHDGRKDLDRCIEKAITMTAGAREPFFLLLHTYSVHNPYGAAPTRDPGSYRWDPRRSKRAYLEGVTFADRKLAAFLDKLSDRGLDDRTLIFLTSDHGEEFAEHHPNRFFDSHGHSVFQELLHVPLIAAGPGVVAGARIREPVGSCDLAPTILGLAGATPLTNAQGVNRAAAFVGGAPSPEAVLLAESAHFAYTETKAARWKNLKLIRTGAAGGTNVFYDLDKDPLERVPLPAAENGDVLIRALAGLSDSPNGPAGAETESISPALIDQLRTLGYAQ